MNIRVFLICLLLGCFAASSFGQGLLVPDESRGRNWRLPRPTPRPPASSYKIKEISIQSRIQDQVARTQVTQSFVNTGSRQMEVCFVFPLPYDGAVDRLTFMVDGKEYDAQLMTKEKARQIYEGYMRRNKDPALLEWMGTGLFKTSVFPIPPGAERSVTLRYTQLLRKSQQLTDYLFPLSTAKYTSHAIEKLGFRVSVETNTALKSVYSPTHDVRTQRDDNQHAVVSYEAKNVIPSNDFRLFFDTAKEELGASLLSYWPRDEDHGYFLLLASPDIKASNDTPQRKTTVLVLDRSGSMNGKKMDQAKEALKYVVNNLREGDLFNIVVYDSEIESFRPELQRYNEGTRKKAIGFVNGIFAGGSTNISSALTTAMGYLRDSSLPSYVVFLTDGRPTAGLRSESEIVKAIEKANRHSARLVSFGVGFDVNSRLIDRLSRANRGRSEYVRPDEDIEAHVSRLYRGISSPVMVGVKTKFDLEGANEGSAVNRVYPRQIHDIFAGQQVTIVGRYNASGAAKIKFAGRVRGKKQVFRFPATLASKSSDETHSFVEKIWASRRIGQIIDQLDLEGRNQELVDELVMLSTKHGIMTPYTSFLADDQANPAELADRGRSRRFAFESAERLGETDGRGAFGLRLSKKFYQEAARVPDADVAQLADHLSTTSSAQLAASPSAKAAQPAYGGVAVPALDGTVRLSSAVMHAGRQTVYRRGQLLVAANASDVDLRKDMSEIEVIQRFTPEYFALIKHNSKGENAILARQKDKEELLVRLRNKVYLIK